MASNPLPIGPDDRTGVEPAQSVLCQLQLLSDGRPRSPEELAIAWSEASRSLEYLAARYMAGRGEPTVRPASASAAGRILHAFASGLADALELAGFSGDPDDILEPDVMLVEGTPTASVAEPAQREIVIDNRWLADASAGGDPRGIGPPHPLSGIDATTLDFARLLGYWRGRAWELQVSGIRASSTDILADALDYARRVNLPAPMVAGLEARLRIQNPALADMEPAPAPFVGASTEGMVVNSHLVQRAVTAFVVAAAGVLLAVSPLAAPAIGVTLPPPLAFLPRPIGILMAVSGLQIGALLRAGISVPPWHRHRAARLLAEVCAETGIPAPPRLVVASRRSSNAWALRLFRRDVFVTTALLRLSDQDVKGVLAHELAHLKHLDTWTTFAAMALLVVANAPPVTMALDSTGPTGRVLDGLIAGLTYFGGIFYSAYLRERFADRTAALATRYGPALAHALEQLASEHEPRTVAGRLLSRGLHVVSWSPHPPSWDRIRRINANVEKRRATLSRGAAPHTTPPPRETELV